MNFFFIYFIYVDTNNSGLKVPILSRAFRANIPQRPRQETFWASVGFESTEESVTLSDAPHRTIKEAIHKFFGPSL